MSMECFTGQCPTPKPEEDLGTIRLSEGSGGAEMHALINRFRKMFTAPSSWQHQLDDSASLKTSDGHLVFTTDSYVVTPLFFPGGNIGKLAFCGTVNDLVVMGADPLGISMSLVLEEGFSKKELFSIMETINALSHQYGIPIVTGDTKVMERGKVDKCIITTSGIGMATAITRQPLCAGDKIIVSGTVGDHGAALLSRRFELESSLVTDSKPLLEEMRAIRHRIKLSKDITRGGLAGVLHEVAAANNVQLHITERLVPTKTEAYAVSNLLGIDILALACEGRLMAIASPETAASVLADLQRIDSTAAIIGEVRSEQGVTVQTIFGEKMLPMPTGTIVPRIC